MSENETITPSPLASSDAPKAESQPAMRNERRREKMESSEEGPRWSRVKRRGIIVVEDGKSYASIPLTKGYRTLIDLVDYSKAVQYNWSVSHNKGGRLAYAATILPDGTRLRLHRVLLECPPGMDVDHINGDGLDNRRENLRIATRSENLFNQRKRSGLTSGYMGVSFDRSRNKWIAQIACNGKRIFLKRFKTELEAAAAYDEAAKRRSHFHRLNFPEMPLPEP